MDYQNKCSSGIKKIPHSVPNNENLSHKGKMTTRKLIILKHSQI